MYPFVCHVKSCNEYTAKEETTNLLLYEENFIEAVNTLYGLFEDTLLQIDVEIVAEEGNYFEVSDNIAADLRRNNGVLKEF